MPHNNMGTGRFNGVLLTHKNQQMDQISTQDLLILHAYGETTLEQRMHLAVEMAKDPGLQGELMELIRGKRLLNSLAKGPSDTSVRIIMEHSYQTEHLQEI